VWRDALGSTKDVVTSRLDITDLNNKIKKSN